MTCRRDGRGGGAMGSVDGSTVCFEGGGGSRVKLVRLAHVDAACMQHLDAELRIESIPTKPFPLRLSVLMQLAFRRFLRLWTSQLLSLLGPRVFRRAARNGLEKNGLRAKDGSHLRPVADVSHLRCRRPGWTCGPLKATPTHRGFENWVGSTAFRWRRASRTEALKPLKPLKYSHRV